MPPHALSSVGSAGSRQDTTSRKSGVIKSQLLTVSYFDPCQRQISLMAGCLCVFPASKGSNRHMQQIPWSEAAVPAAPSCPLPSPPLPPPPPRSASLSSTFFLPECHFNDPKHALSPITFECHPPELRPTPPALSATRLTRGRLRQGARSLFSHSFQISDAQRVH